LAAVTFAVYAQTLQFQFVSWDDPDYIYENPHIAQGVTQQSVAWAFTSAHASNWHPLTWISHMLDVQLFGLERGPGEGILRGPGGHHLVSVLLHTANSLLLLLLLYRMTGAFWPSALCAALFAIHPLHVESVAWVSERKDVLSGLFFMLTLLAYHWYTQRTSFMRYVLVFTSLAFGLMAKPMLVTVPFLLLLLDLWPLRRMQFEQKETKVTKVDCSAFSAGPAEKANNQSLCFVNFVSFCLKMFPAKRPELTVSESNPTPVPGIRFLILEKLPLLGLVLASCLVTMQVQRMALVALDKIPWAWRLVNTPVSYVMYLCKTVWPSKLAFLYPHPVDILGAGLGDWVFPAIGATLFLAFVSLVVILKARSRPYLLVGWLWFLGMLVPVIGLMQVGSQAWANRYAYLPLVGVYVMLSWSLNRWVHDRPAARRGVIAVAAAALLALLPFTCRQVAVWRNSQSLYEHALAVTRNNYMVHNNWGLDLQEQGRIQEAMGHYEQALRIKPNSAETHINWGCALQDIGRAEDALVHFREALRIKPDAVKAHNNWGNALQALGRLDEALAHYQQALEIQPDYATAHFSWGVALAASGAFQDAVEHYRKAVELEPDLAVAHHNLGVLYAGAGRLEEAIRQFELALRARPDFAPSRQSLRKARAQLQEENPKYE
jgi:tetratricopeptide (TPR) repeat protein